MKKIISGSIFLFGIFLGVCLSQISHLQFDTQINLIDMGNLIVVIILAFIIPATLTVRLDNKKTHKELLILEISTLCENLLEIDKMINEMLGNTPTRDQFNKATSSFKRARNQMLQIKEEIIYLNNPESTQMEEQLSKALKEYWISVTGNDGIKISNFTVDIPFIWRQGTKYENTVKIARGLKFKINKST